MATARIRYEVAEGWSRPNCFAVHAYKGKLYRGCIATGMTWRDAVLFKQAKEAQGEAASQRNRRANRKKKIAHGGPIEWVSVRPVLND